MPTILSTPANGLKMRVRLELRQKVEIVNFLASGKNHVEAAKHFPRTTVATIAKDKEKILAEFSKNRNSAAKSFKKSPFDVIDEQLVRWVTLMRENKVPISGDLIQKRLLRSLLKKESQTFACLVVGVHDSKPDTIFVTKAFPAKKAT